MLTTPPPPAVPCPHRQLLSKIDGVNSLNNILLIGMTNRMDMIDEALLRPGRLEIHVEIGLPDEAGRLQILNIHTRKMRGSGRISPVRELWRSHCCSCCHVVTITAPLLTTRPCCTVGCANAQDVNLGYWAERTKNFTGAELEGLVKVC